MTAPKRTRPVPAQDTVRKSAKRAFLRGIAAYDAAWRTYRRRRPRVLLYTDSRGQNVSTRAAKLAKHHLGSHIDALQRRHRVEHHLAPFAHTTIIDFLTLMDERDWRDYDAIILQCGIVDFSPRPISSIEQLRRSKAGNDRFDELFEANGEHHSQPLPDMYEGQKTTTLYSVEYLTGLLPVLRAIPNLIWISSNNFVPGWDGNWRPRPSGIDAIVRAYDQVLLDALPHTVNLHDWSDEEVQRFTVDNVHFTRAGFREVLARTENVLEPVLASRSAVTHRA